MAALLQACHTLAVMLYSPSPLAGKNSPRIGSPIRGRCFPDGSRTFPHQVRRAISSLRASPWILVTAFFINPIRVIPPEITDPLRDLPFSKYPSYGARTT